MLSKAHGSLTINNKCRILVTIQDTVLFSCSLTGIQKIMATVKNGKKVAVLVPYSTYASTPERSLGLLKNRAGRIIHDDFEISEKEMLAS